MEKNYCSVVSFHLTPRSIFVLAFCAISICLSISLRTEAQDWFPGDTGAVNIKNWGNGTHNAKGDGVTTCAHPPALSRTHNTTERCQPQQSGVRGRRTLFASFDFLYARRRKSIVFEEFDVLLRSGYASTATRE